jgi:Tfp pilus assembly protein FimT
MTALVAPRLAGTLASTSARASVKRIAAALRYARNHAASEKAVYIAAFHGDTSQVAVGKMHRPTAEDPLDDSGGPLLISPRVFTLSAGVEIERVISASGDTEDEDPALIIFYPNGASTGGRVVVVDDKNRSAALVVDAIMGTVSLED